MGNLMQSKATKQIIKVNASQDKITITIKMPNKSTELQVKRTDKIKTIKYKVQDLHNIKWNEQKLAHKNIELKNESVVSDYTIQNMDVIELTIIKGVVVKEDIGTFSDKSQFSQFNNLKNKPDDGEERLAEWRKMRRHMNPDVEDIGVFSEGYSTQYSQVLQGKLNCLDEQQAKVNELITKFNANPSATYSIHNLQIDDRIFKKVTGYADQQFAEAQTNNMDMRELDDLKITLDRNSLISLIGQDLYDKLEAIFGAYNEIIIRRCQAHGRLIDFHTDVSKRTMQLALNNDSEYVGGRLIFASQNKFSIPSRPKGTVTIHDNTIVHGVTRLESGIRYGLFLLKK